KKVNQAGEALEGATFQFPFYVKKTAASDGAYIYAFATLPTSFASGDSADNYTNQLTTPADGLIVVKGVESGNYTVTETDPPSGYNKLTDSITVTAETLTTTTTSTTIYLDKDGNVVDQQTTDGSTVTVSLDNIAASAEVVVNKAGVELPATGGIGTTLFIVFGSVLAVAAGVVIVTNKRAKKEEI
ncbi:MAG: LPXTG cell wall anchor domain-containing protein, partial [Clostridia bacterium]|nr:LPXTG cell wall anchor domain-containing protein [Clostridia bacterium]